MNNSILKFVKILSGIREATTLTFEEILQRCLWEVLWLRPAGRRTDWSSQMFPLIKIKYVWASVTMKALSGRFRQARKCAGLLVPTQTACRHCPHFTANSKVTHFRSSISDTEFRRCPPTVLLDTEVIKPNKRRACGVVKAHVYINTVTEK